MATKNWNGFKKSGDIYIPNDANARAGVIANTKLIKDTVGWSGKNKNGSKYTGITTQGVTFTVNPDNSVKGNGTNSSSSNEARPVYTNFNLKAGSYKFSCKNATANFYAFVWDATNSRRLVTVTDSADHEFSVDSDIEAGVLLSVPTAVTINNQTLYPMIRPADILDDTYEPYFGSTAFPRSEQAVLGASWNELDVTASGKTENGVTFTINADKSITFVTDAGGATADTSIVFNPDYQITDADTHYYSGVSNGGADKYYLECYYRDNSNTYKGNTRVYDGVVPINVSDKTGAIKINTFILMVKSGFISTTPITVYPMVAPKADALYAPYAMPNRKLTEKVQGIINAATNAADFAAFKTAIGNL